MFHYWIILVFGFFLLWLFLGRKDTKFVGLNPLFSNEPLPDDPMRMKPFNNIKNRKSIQSQRSTVDALPSALAVRSGGPDLKIQSPQGSHSPQGSAPNNRFNSKGQKQCCQIMEEIYGQPFVCARPGWLKNPETGGILEIDCYNEDLKIGVEYNGIQHYVYPNVYHKSLIEFKNQVRRDQYKLKKCEENGVYLITVPYNVPPHKMKEFILCRLPQEDLEGDENYTDLQDFIEEEYETDDLLALENEVSMLDNPDQKRVNIPTTICYQEYLA